jgi:hypothetical protein
MTQTTTQALSTVFDMATTHPFGEGENSAA